MKEKNKITLTDILGFVFFVILAIDISLILRDYCFSFVRVSGTSMETSFHDKDVIAVSKFGRYFGGYERFDVIVFKPFEYDDPETENEDESKTLYIKRIVGMPGETIYIDKSGAINITDSNGNTTVLEDKFCLSPMTHGIDLDLEDDFFYDTITLGPDEYFVLGDNRQVSRDSRNPKVGPVNKNCIEGRYKFKFFSTKSK